MRHIVVMAAAVALVLGLTPPAAGEDVEITRAKGLVARVAASYDGSELTAEIAVREYRRKQVDLVAVAVDTGGGPGAERTLYATPHYVELEDQDLVLVPCPDLAYEFGKRRYAFSIPADCLGEEAPAQVRVRWTLQWSRWVEGERRCGYRRLPDEGFSIWLDPAVARGC